MKKILFVIGSLRNVSTNRMLAKLVESEFLKEKAGVSYLDYSDLPMINPDIEFPAPDSVQRVRDAVAACDGMWIFFPEYNHSYPGVLKNMLDWISRPVEKGAPRTTAISSGVPVTYSSISGKGGAVKAFVKMADLMEKIHMDDMPGDKAAFSEPEVTDGELVLNEEQMQVLKDQAERFLQWIER